MAEFWTPLYLDRSSADRENHFLWVSGRLPEGINHDQAQQEADAIARGLIEQYPESNAGWIVRVEDINGALASDQIWTIFNLMALTVVFVMLIACSNVATMMLSRSAARTKEIAVRAALGAQRSRLLGQMLTESLLLSIAAGALGLATTRLCLSGLVWMAGDNAGTNFFSLLTIDRNVLLFTGAVALLAPMLFGFVPALRASRTDLSETLKDSSRGSTGGTGLRRRKFLVATQVSLALTLMVVAGLLIRTMVNQRLFDLGIETEGVLTFRLDLPEGRYAEEHQWLPFFDEVMERVDALPGIESAGWLSARPIQEQDGTQAFLVEGGDIPEVDQLPFATVSTATQGALDVLELSVVRGRGFEPADTLDSLPIVLVNEDMVERYWNGETPIGRRLRFGGIDSTEPWLTVVGVVGNLFTGNPDNPTFPQAIIPMHQNPRQGMGFVARPTGDPLALVPALRQQVWAVDPDQPLGDVRTLSQIFSDNLATFDTIITIFIVFAVFALIMASTGIYGVISFAVAQRTQEIGIRMALGAHGNEVMRMIGRQAMWLVGAGIAVGAAGAYRSDHRAETGIGRADDGEGRLSRRVRNGRDADAGAPRRARLRHDDPPRDRGAHRAIGVDRRRVHDAAPVAAQGLGVFGAGRAVAVARRPGQEVLHARARWPRRVAALASDVREPVDGRSGSTIAVEVMLAGWVARRAPSASFTGADRTRSAPPPRQRAPRRTRDRAASAVGCAAPPRSSPSRPPSTGGSSHRARRRAPSAPSSS